jgi:hypothetical protein
MIGDTATDFQAQTAEAPIRLDRYWIGHRVNQDRLDRLVASDDALAPRCCLGNHGGGMGLAATRSTHRS